MTSSIQSSSDITSAKKSAKCPTEKQCYAAAEQKKYCAIITRSINRRLDPIAVNASNAAAMYYNILPHQCRDNPRIRALLNEDFNRQFRMLVPKEITVNGCLSRTVLNGVVDQFTLERLNCLRTITAQERFRAAEDDEYACTANGMRFAWCSGTSNPNLIRIMSMARSQALLRFNQSKRAEKRLQLNGEQKRLLYDFFKGSGWSLEDAVYFDLSDIESLFYLPSEFALTDSQKLLVVGYYNALARISEVAPAAAHTFTKLFDSLMPLMNLAIKEESTASTSSEKTSLQIVFDCRLTSLSNSLTDRTLDLIGKENSVVDETDTNGLHDSLRTLSKRVKWCLESLDAMIDTYNVVVDDDGGGGKEEEVVEVNANKEVDSNNDSHQEKEGEAEVNSSSNSAAVSYCLAVPSDDEGVVVKIET